MCGNEEEQKHLEELGIEVVVADWYEIVLEDAKVSLDRLLRSYAPHYYRSQND
jgi:hypothetical protein